MSIIKQNPFRVLGLTGNSSEKELQKQISTIKAYARVGKSKTFDFDFGFIGDFSRTLEDIQKAASRIEQAKNKLHYALLWFINNNQFDEIALNNLKNENTEKAIEIWEKTLKEEISNKNYSSYLNLSTLYIALATINGQLDIQRLQKGIDLKGTIINSENIRDFSNLVTGNGFAINALDISKKFIEEIIELLKPYLNKDDGLTTNQLISLFNSFPQDIQKYLSNKFTEVPISNIENEISKAVAKRKESPKNLPKFVASLFMNTKDDLIKSKTVLGTDNIQFQMITNKLANEIIQCAIDFFNTHINNNTGYDPGDESIKMTKFAKSLQPTGQTKHRIEENTAIMQAWVDDKPRREKQNLVKTEIDFIKDSLMMFQEKISSTFNAQNLVKTCKPKLDTIANTLGEGDEFYLYISDAVVNNALGMVISIVNDAQSGIEFNHTKLLALPATIFSALSVVKLIGKLDMSPEVLAHYNSNKSIITIIHLQTKAVQKSSSGCYIATMAYGDFDHPQVLELRKVRDDVLANSIIGRIFISFYYATSPKLVRVLRNHKRINEIIRNILDRFIKLIKL